MAHAQCDTIRLKLLKIGALIRITVRKVWVSLAGGYPYAELFWQIHAKLSPCRCGGTSPPLRNSLRLILWQGGLRVRADLPPAANQPSCTETRLDEPILLRNRTCSPVLPISTSPIRTGEKYGLSTDPDNLAALTMIARTQLVAGKYDLALANARKVNASKPPHPALAHLIAAQALELKGDAADSVVEYKAFIQESPDNPLSPRIKAAVEHYEQGQAQSAAAKSGPASPQKQAPVPPKKQGP